MRHPSPSRTAPAAAVRDLIRWAVLPAATLLLVALLGSIARAVDADPDHFLCYKAKPAKAPRGTPPFPRFGPTQAERTDRVGGPFAFDLKKTLTLCNPADKSGEDPTAPGHDGHEVAYKAKRVRGEPKFDRKGAVIEIRNQFHASGLKLKLTAEDRLLVASAKALGPGGAPAPPEGLTDFKCYKVAVAKARRGEPPFPAFTPRTGVAVTDQFLSRLFDVKKPLRICHPVLDPNAALPADDAPAHLACYQVKLAREPKQEKVPPQLVSTRNALAEEVLATKTPEELCVPTTVIASADDWIRFVGRVEAQVRMANENFPVLLRPAIEAYYPEIVALIAEGPAALDRILAEFVPDADLLDDIPLLLLAYALEQIGDPRAVPLLAEWLERHVFRELVWAPEFVTHALKVLDGQDGLNTTTFVYPIDEKLDTIARARGGSSGLVDLVAASAMSEMAADGVELESARSARAATPPGDCTKRLIVRGLTALGEPEEVSFNYTVVTRDLDQRIAEERDPAKRASLIQLRTDEYLVPDEQTYGGSSYQALPGAGVSMKSNCGGSVAERVLNRVAVQKGLPIVLGPGRAAADDIREVARRFGTEVGFGAIDRATVISHDRSDDTSAHVEVPLATTTGLGATIYSKDNFGIERTHAVSFSDDVAAAFAPPIARYGTRSFNPFSFAGTHFYRIDPDRILEILLDSSGCPCDPDAPGSIPVMIGTPAASSTGERVLTIGGTVGDPSVTAGTLRVNGAPQAIAVAGGAFTAQVVLKSGDNTLAVGVDAPDGRRGCTERTIRSTALRTTISVTLTWNLDRTDVDLYVTQPDGETAWYGSQTTSIGRLDVDNTRGFGPENYFVSAAASDTVLPGPYTVRVHYYDDDLDGEETPTRTVGWRVVAVVNEGTPQEHREIKTGTIGFASASNDAPGSTGSDWRTATVLTIPAN